MKFSEEKQSFKIGRMTYGLPSFVKIDGRNFYLQFTYSVTLWSAQYVCFSDDLEALLCEEKTFNKALKALHAKVKEQS